jgi:hypothetical protein
MFGGWILSALHLVSIRLDGFHTLTLLLDKLGKKSPRWKIPCHVDLYQNLAGRAITCTNSDSRDGQFFRDEARDLCWDGFQDHCKAAGGLDSKGIFEDFEGSAGCLALDFKSSEGILPLWGQSDMAKNWDSGRCNLVNGRCHFLASLELDGLNPSFLDEADGGLESLLWSNLISAHGEIANLGRISAMRFNDSFSSCDLQ